MIENTQYGPLELECTFHNKTLSNSLAPYQLVKDFGTEINSINLFDEPIVFDEFGHHAFSYWSNKQASFFGSFHVGIFVFGKNLNGRRISVGTG